MRQITKEAAKFRLIRETIQFFSVLWTYVYTLSSGMWIANSFTPSNWLSKMVFFPRPLRTRRFLRRRPSLDPKKKKKKSAYKVLARPLNLVAYVRFFVFTNLL